MNQKVKILVIGAGPAGLSTLKALIQLKPSQRYQINCIQKQKDWSGQWNYDWRSTTDEHGQHVHSSMYRQLWTNIPKQIFQFPDYTFQEHFGHPTPSYLPRQVFKQYFMKRFQRLELRKYIKFQHIVRNVTFDNKQKKFTVRITNFSTNQDIIDYYEHVVVATGHFSYPYMPDFPGLQKFNGKVMHSHNVRQFSQFKDKRLLVIGGNLSAEDLVIQSYKYGCQAVVWTHRNLKFNYDRSCFPDNIQIIPDLVRFNSDYACFGNNQKRKIDIIVFCTGYLHKFPFLEEGLRLESGNITWPLGLHQSVVWEKNPQLFYIGMGNYLISQIIFDVQGYLVRDIIGGKYKIPNLQERDSEDVARFQQMLNAKSLRDILRSVIKYCKNLMKITGYSDYNLEGVIDIFLENVRQRQQNVFTYRDKGTFKSVITGQESIPLFKPWLQIKESQVETLQGQKTVEKILKPPNFQNMGKSKL